MNHRMSGLPVRHQLPEFTQTHVHRVDDAIQLSHPLALNLSQHQGHFHWVNSAYKMAKVSELQLFFDPTDVGNLISVSSAFSKSSLYIWKFSGHKQLKPSLKDFEHDLASVWNACNCVVVWTYFGIALLWDWNENWPFAFPYMTTGKTIALTRWTFVGKVMSLLFNMLSMLVIAFLPRSKRLLIS